MPIGPKTSKISGKCLPGSLAPEVSAKSRERSAKTLPTLSGDRQRLFGLFPRLWDFLGFWDLRLQETFFRLVWHFRLKGSGETFVRCVRDASVRDLPPC